VTTPDAVPLSGPRFQTEPARLYREMRRDHGAVVPVLLDGDIPAWLVLGYRELHQVTGDPVLFSRDSDLWNQWENIPADWPLLPMIGRKQPSILYTVGERHRQRAAMVSNALEAVDAFELRGHAERFADELIDALCSAGEADLIAQYAMLLPVRVLARLYGFSDEDGPGLVTALNDMIDGRERALAGQAHLAGSMARLVADRRKEPADDVVSRMLADDSGFSDEEIVQDLMVMLAAGHQPTADWIGNSLRLMLTDDRFAASLFGGRNSVAEAMNEVLWEDTPTQNVAGRWAARDTRLGGRAVRAGDLLLLGLQGANSDPQVRTDASVLTGGNNAHFSFGHGEHRCPFPAQEVAEVIARTGIEVVLDRLPADSLTRRPSPWLRGLTGLPVRFTPVPAG
jgi:cytochrome P450